MNGATAEPWVRTTRPPNSTSTTTMGRSQNFFRSRMNIHSSTANSLMGGYSCSELPQQVGTGSRLPEHPVRGCAWIAGPLHLVASGEALHEAHRGDQAEEDQTQHQASVDPAQDAADGHPDPVGGREHPRGHHGGHDEG